MSVDDILTIKLNSNDNVATAFNNIAKGEITQNIEAENDIPKGHKIALKKILKGEKIIKYDQITGLAKNDINIGEHVHVENTSSSQQNMIMSFQHQ